MGRKRHTPEQIITALREAEVAGSVKLISREPRGTTVERLLTVLDEYTRECLAIVVARKIRSHERARGSGRALRSSQSARIYARTTGQSSRPSSYLGRLVCANALHRAEVLGRTATTRASTARLRDEFLNGEIFYTLPEAVVLVEQWRRLYNTVRPHSAFGGQPPAPETIKPSSWFLRMPHLLGPPIAQGLT